MFDLKTRKVFLKRCKADNIRMEHLYIGSTVNILSRQLNIVDIGNLFLRKFVISSKLNKQYGSNKRFLLFIIYLFWEILLKIRFMPYK